VPLVDRLDHPLAVERVLIDLDVDEVRSLGVGGVQLLHGFELRRAGRAGAQGGRGEQHHQRLLATLQRLGDAERVQVAGRVVAADVRGIAAHIPVGQ
jgi:hypothetical protein